MEQLAINKESQIMPSLSAAGYEMALLRLLE